MQVWDGILFIAYLECTFGCLIKSNKYTYKYTRTCTYKYTCRYTRKYKRDRPPPGGGEGGASSNIDEGGGGVHRGRELGCPLGELPLHQGKGSPA